MYRRILPEAASVALATLIAISAGTGATGASKLAAAAAPASASASASAPGTTLRFVVAPTGNEARYRVREQLLHADLPNDAVGITSGITGVLTLVDGKVVPSESHITIDVRSLKSDRDFRDRYVLSRLLVTDSFPSVTFAPTEIRGAPVSPSPGQTYTMDVAGNMTLKGVAHPTVWHVTARQQEAGGSIVGSASTSLTFANFGLTKPTVPVLLSVADTIKLEYDFHLIPDIPNVPRVENGQAPGRARDTLATLRHDPFFGFKPFLAGITVPDVEKSAQWYEDKLGFTKQEEFDIDGFRQIVVNRGSFAIELAQKKGTFPITKYDPEYVSSSSLLEGFDRLGFAVDDLDLAVPELRRRNVHMVRGLTTLKAIGLRFIVIQDDNGNRIQIFDRKVAR